MNKKLFYGVIAILAVALLAGLYFFTQQKKSQPLSSQGIVKIVADLPLTGNFAYYGNEVKHSLELLTDSAKKYSIEFVFEDNQSNANQSVAIFNKYSTDNSVPLIITCNSPFSAPLRAFADRYKKNQLALVTGALGFCDDFNWVFRDAITQDQEGELLAKYVINDPSFKKVALCAVNDDYGLGGIKAFKEIISKNGIEISSEELYTTGNNDFKNTISKLLNKKPDILLFVGREQSYISFINQLRQRNKDIPLLCTDSFESQSVYEGIGENASGVIFASYYNDLDNPVAIQYMNAFKKNFGSKPGIYAIDAYVAGQYLIDIISKGSTDADAINKGLSTLIFDSDLKGKLTVKDRSVISNVALYKLNNNHDKELLFNE